MIPDNQLARVIQSKSVWDLVADPPGKGRRGLSVRDPVADPPGKGRGLSPHESRDLMGAKAFLYSDFHDNIFAYVSDD